MPEISILNGPNFNLLGVRQPELYGHETLADLKARCEARAAALGLTVRFEQSNHEGELVEWIQQARDRSAGIVINAAAYTHTSIAILDALNSFDGPVLEIHVSNIHAREDFRRHSFVSLRADGVIAGFGLQGYELCLDRMATLLAA